MCRKAEERPSEDLHTVARFRKSTETEGTPVDSEPFEQPSLHARRRSQWLSASPTAAANTTQYLGCGKSGVCRSPPWHPIGGGNTGRIAGDGASTAAVHTRRGSTVRFPPDPLTHLWHRPTCTNPSERAALHYTAADYSRFKAEYYAVLLARLQRKTACDTGAEEEDEENVDDEWGVYETMEILVGATKKLLWKAAECTGQAARMSEGEVMMLNDTLYLF